MVADEGIVIWQALSALGVGALVGGAGGAYLTHVLSQHREQQQRDKEKQGLLRILYADTANNLFQVSFLGPSGPLFVRKFIADEAKDQLHQNLQTSAWEATRLKLAQHLSSEEFAVFADYYRRITGLEQVLESEPFDDTNHQAALSILAILEDRGPRVEQLIRKYVPDVTFEPPDEASSETLG